MPGDEEMDLMAHQPVETLAGRIRAVDAKAPGFFSSLPSACRTPPTRPCVAPSSRPPSTGRGNLPGPPSRAGRSAVHPSQALTSVSSSNWRASLSSSASLNAKVSSRNRGDESAGSANSSIDSPAAHRRPERSGRHAEAVGRAAECRGSMEGIRATRSAAGRSAWG